MILELANPKRKLIQSKQEYINFINSNHGIFNLYKSIYNFKYLSNQYKPDYTSAIVDKMFFDFDNEEKSLSNVIKFHNYLVQHNIQHYMVQSSYLRFHVYVMCYGKILNKKIALMNAMVYLAQENNFSYGYSKNDDLDKSTFGDLARITAIPSTYKPKRKCWTSYISETDLYDLNALKLKSETGNGEKYVYGTIKFNLEDYDGTDSNPSISIKFQISEFNVEFKESHTKLLPPFLQKVIMNYKEYGNWENRYRFTVYCRDFGYPIEVTRKIAQQYFSKVKRTDHFSTNYDHYKSQRILEKVYNHEDKLEKYKFPDWSILAKDYEIESQDILAINNLYL